MTDNKKIAIDLPLNIYKALKLHSAINDVTMSKIIIDAITEKLNNGDDLGQAVKDIIDGVSGKEDKEEI
jgi:hypothetical protein